MSLEWSAHAYSSCFELSDINEYPRRPHPFLKFHIGNFWGGDFVTTLKCARHDAFAFCQGKMKTFWVH